mmetsp:Transcript_74352/g.221830  ORF Transcript_74352/g.221830 Transcript_74352/m.221830 type:complete len:186 (+) Transcript_74352:123-680(+)
MRGARCGSSGPGAPPPPGAPPGRGGRATRRRRQLHTRRKAWLRLEADKGKFEGGDKENTEKAEQATLDWLDKNQQAEKDEFERKELEGVINPIRVSALAELGWDETGEEEGAHSEDGGTAEGGVHDDRNEEYMKELGRHKADNDYERIDPMVLLALRDEARALTELTNGGGDSRNDHTQEGIYHR